ncbi:MAG: VCBS repeat-containing protein [Candidatus Eisenbacteria bacterium]|nr:VCBS repeat-containing protein [Candidatus Eisenbacteria bacterium]
MRLLTTTLLVLGFIAAVAQSVHAETGSVRLILRSRAATPLAPGATNSLPAPLCYANQAWGDYDNDGDLDLLQTGSTSINDTLGVPQTLLYQNDGTGNFVPIATTLPKVWRGYVEWGDYDNDGMLDLLLTGQPSPNFRADSSITSIYHNDGNGAFSLAASGVPHFTRGSVGAWADFDKDGRLDIAITGGLAGQAASRIYHNNGDGTFTDVNAGVSQVRNGSVAWADFDNDGDFDLALPGWPYQPPTGSDPGIYANSWPTSGFVRKLDLYEYGQAFYADGAMTIADYNNDGLLDFFQVGPAPPRLYRNDGNFAFTRVVDDTTLAAGGGKWADYDNDGRPDLLNAFGNWVEDEYGIRHIQINVIYHNDNDSTFSWGLSWLPGLYYGDADWADIDNNGSLDFLVTGRDRYGVIHSQLGDLSLATPNTVPTAPTSLAAQWMGYGYRLSWAPASDAETPSAGLTYNVRVGTTPGGCDVVSPMSDASTGYRRIVALGNAQKTESWIVDVPPGTYYWSVQAIDGMYAGGQWAQEATFTAITSVDPPAAGSLSLSVHRGGANVGRVVFAVSLASSEPATLEIFDVSGRRVSTPISGTVAAGVHEVVWDRTDSGTTPQSGIYFARLRQAGQVRVARAVVL